MFEGGGGAVLLFFFFVLAFRLNLREMRAQQVVFVSVGVILRSGVVGKVYVPKKIVDPIIESVTLEPELEEALASATDAELCDIAGNSVAIFIY